MNSALASLLSTALVATVATALPAGAAAMEWIQLLPAGTFTAIDGRGPFETGDRASMQETVDRTLEAQGSRQIPIDYDHQTVFGAIEGVGGRAPAAGWIKELQVRDDGIWARVKWTKPAAAAIEAEEYKYISPVFFSTKAGKVMALQMASLTNTPAFDMTAIAASSLIRKPSNEGEPMDKIAAALGLAAGTGEDAVLSALNAVLTATTAMAAAAGLKADAEPAEIQTAVTAAFSDRAKIAGAKPDPAKFVPIEQVTQLQSDVKSLQDAAKETAAKTVVAAAIKKGQLAPSLEQWGLDLAKADLAKFEAFTAGAPVLTKPQLETPNRKPGDDLNDPVQLAASATAYQKKLADAGQTIDYASAVTAVKAGKK